MPKTQVYPQIQNEVKPRLTFWLVLFDLSNVYVYYTPETFSFSDYCCSPFVLTAMGNLDEALSSGSFPAFRNLKIVLAAQSSITFPKLEAAGVKVDIIYHKNAWR